MTTLYEISSGLNIFSRAVFGVSSLGEGVVAAACGGVSESHSCGDTVLEFEVDIQVFRSASS